MASGEFSKAQRLFLMAALLREQHATVREIALYLHPTARIHGEGWSALERAVQRDLRELAELEPAFETLGGRPPRYRIVTHRTTLHPTTVLTLHAAARLMYHRAPGNRTHHQAAVKQLAGFLPERVQRVSRLGMQDIGKRRSREDLNLEHAAQAWLGGHPLQFEYRKPGGSGQWRTNVIETYLIEAHPQNLDLYLIGPETSFHRDVRTFKLARMRALRVLTEQTYAIPETFDPSEFFHAAWGVVGGGGGRSETMTLRFRPDAAYRILEGGYAHLSEPYIHSDGSITTTLEAPLDGSGLPREVLPWILSFGPRVEVLEPPHLRAHWLGELRAALAGAEDGMTVEDGLPEEEKT